LLGLALLVGCRLAVWERTGLAEPAFRCANALMSLGFVAAGLLTLSRLGAVHWSLVVLLAGLAALSLAAVVRGHGHCRGRAHVPHGTPAVQQRPTERVGLPMSLW
jgi:hypothetical protein